MRTALLIAACVGLLSSASQQPATSADPLAPLAFLAGGTWRGEGRWPDGSALRDEVRYFWGPTRHLLHFESFDLTSGDRRLLYEGVIVFDPSRGKLTQWNIKPTGEVDVREIDQVDATGFTVFGERTRSTVRRTGPDAFRWELRIPQDGAWNLILDATYTRADEPARPPR
jgi:hypothetical protein